MTLTAHALLATIALVTSCKGTTQSTSNSIQLNILLPATFSARSQLASLGVLIDSTTDAGVFDSAVAQQTGKTEDGYDTLTEIANFDADAPLEWRMVVQSSPFGAGGTAWQTYLAGSPTGALFRVQASVKDNASTTLAEAAVDTDSTGQSIRFGPSERVVTIQLACTSAAYCAGDAGSATDAGSGADAGADAGAGLDAGYDAGSLLGNPTSLGDPSAGDIDNYEVSADVEGNAAVTWYEVSASGGGSGVVRATWYRMNGGWSPPTDISSWDGGGQSLSIAAFDAGAAWVAWRQAGSAWVRRISGFTGLATPAILLVDGGNTTFLNLAASKTTGETVLVYRTHDGTGNNLYTRKNPDDGGSYGWGGATLIEFDNQGDVSNPQIAMANAGAYIVGWLSWASVDNVWGAYCTVSGGCVGNDGGTLLETNSGNATSPRVGMRNTNDSVVVWVQPTTNPRSIWSVRRSSGGNFQSAGQIWTGGDIGNLRFALGPVGGMGYAAWEEGGSIYRQIYSIGSDTWGDAGVAATGASSPAVAVDNSGSDNGLIVWVQNGAVRMTQINSSGSEMMSSVRVSAVTDGGVTTPRVVAGSAGKAVVFWRGLDGARWNLYGNPVNIN